MEDRRRENIKLQILKHTIFSILMLMLLLISSLLETYISGRFKRYIFKVIANWKIFSQILQNVFTIYKYFDITYT